MVDIPLGSVKDAFGFHAVIYKSKDVLLGSQLLEGTFDSRGMTKTSMPSSQSCHIVVVDPEWKRDGL